MQDNYENQFKALEDKYLEGKPEGFKELTKGDSRRAALLGTCQECDAINADVDREETLRIVAAEARRKSLDQWGKTHPTGGRRPKTLEEIALFEYLESRENSKYDARAAIKAWANYLEKSYSSWHSVQKLEQLSQKQKAEAQKAIEALESALASAEKAEQLHREGRAIMRKASAFLAFSSNPFLSINAEELRNFIKSFKTKSEVK